MNIPDYSDEQFWNNIIDEYIKNRQKFVTWIDLEKHLWNYFKYCLQKGNRYYFQHPLLPLLESELSKHVYILRKNVEIYRARNDENYRLWNEWLDYCKIESTPPTIKKIEDRNVDEDIVNKLWRDYNTFVSSEHTQQIKKRVESGFQGFDAEESSAPPADMAIEGRCNLKGVSYLYAALEEHTAVAEIRPHIKDTISIATIKPICDLKLIDFDYEPSKTVHGEDFLFNNIQHEFSLIHKEQSKDYLVTQYITSLIEHLGYDGLCFRSSLVKDGTNYVIFKPDNCSIVSSDLCLLTEVKYNYGKCKK